MKNEFCNADTTNVNLKDVMAKLIEDLENSLKNAEEKLKLYEGVLIGEGWVVVRGTLLQHVEGNQSIPCLKMTGYSMFDEKTAKKVANNFKDTEAMHIVDYLNDHIKSLKGSIEFIKQKQ